MTHADQCQHQPANTHFDRGEAPSTAKAPSFKQPLSSESRVAPARAFVGPVIVIAAVIVPSHGILCGRALACGFLRSQENRSDQIRSLACGFSQTQENRRDQIRIEQYTNQPRQAIHRPLPRPPLLPPHRYILYIYIIYYILYIYTARARSGAEVFVGSQSFSGPGVVYRRWRMQRRRGRRASWRRRPHER